MLMQPSFVTNEVHQINPNCFYSWKQSIPLHGTAPMIKNSSQHYGFSKLSPKGQNCLTKLTCISEETLEIPTLYRHHWASGNLPSEKEPCFLSGLRRTNSVHFGFLKKKKKKDLEILNTLATQNKEWKLKSQFRKKNCITTMNMLLLECYTHACSVTKS